MKTYINKETGVVITTESELSGDWELVETTEKPKTTQKRKVDKNETVEE
jgi:hypothetical protein|nr:MAG TPA: hypothetical protein [Caudoviricetes sp.]DAY25572.1 MAG TPA: hypothetical protein [Caudoviricetes sp.]